MVIHHRRSRGFTYLGVLLALALIGIGLVAASEVWVTVARRQRLAQLDWVGGEFVAAIGSYYEASPGSAKVYPQALSDLVEDRRYLGVRRHLRRIYPNPFTGQTDWELVLGGDGRVHGVRVAIPGEGEVAAREFIFAPVVAGTVPARR